MAEYEVERFWNVGIEVWAGPEHSDRLEASLHACLRLPLTGATMSIRVWPIGAQIKRLKSFFPRSHGKPWGD